MKKISVVISGPKYSEYSIDYAASTIKNIFFNAEIILSTNDKELILSANKNKLINKIIYSEDIGELPSLKFPTNGGETNNNNINKQRTTCLEGIKAASNNLVLRLRSDQLILDDSILGLWENIEKIPHNNDKEGRIITSSIFSINPRYTERMPYHISDMLQFGYKNDLISYFSAPPYPFEYATWYERNRHHKSSNEFEKLFRSKFAVEQWLTLHYIFKEEKNFPISYHNECNESIIAKFERELIEYFIIAHPKDINLRANKFSSAESYYNTQCYSTKECLCLLAQKYPEFNHLIDKYSEKGINKKYFSTLMPLIYSPISQLLIKRLSTQQKNKIKEILNKLA
ncbi:WavE lipopolysaccharide synthesis family protein [Escherichia coli]|uniref:WavE lipopolysaccharide synthesis family protein n=1 Tax=Escherichia coli TaxID=562 RepID=UPI00053BAB3F|nr:WavE lipopolysaccharide synthesis family protein [Escherichia coli]EFD4990037.1 hypothetical protein [Escherichia coli]EFK2595661.1 hypothetical protein [Escherichia coli]MCI3551977.1 WavE lipopolysaccharide synthesis family protein [Escherichia coli]HAG7879647.1 hypothetical protein [Escherichia coli]HAI8596561.1 hypothetical protein [Escherichia coli]